MRLLPVLTFAIGLFSSPINGLYAFISRLKLRTLRQLDFFTPPKFSAFDTLPLFSSYLSLFLVGFFRIAGNGLHLFPGRINPRHPPTSKDRVLTVLVSVAHVSLIALMSHGLFSLLLGFVSKACFFSAQSVFFPSRLTLFDTSSLGYEHIYFSLLNPLSSRRCNKNYEGR